MEAQAKMIAARSAFKPHSQYEAEGKGPVTGGLYTG